MSERLQTRVIRGLGWSAAQNVGMRLVAFLIYPVLARILGPEAYGLVAMAAVFVAALDVFSDVSFGAAIEQRDELHPLHLDTVFWLFFLLGIVLTTGGMLAASPVAAFFREADLAPIIRWLSVGLMLQMVSGVQTSLLRRELHIKRLATINIMATVIGGALGIAMALRGAGVWSLVVQRLTNQAVLTGALWATSSWKPRPMFSLQHLRDMTGFGLSVMGDRILNYVNRQSDQLLIGRMLGSNELAYYFNASRLQQLATNLFIGSFSQVAMPAFAKLQHDRERFQAAYIRACRLTTLVAFPAFVGLFLLSRELVSVVLAERWLPSSPALSALALAGVVHSIQYINGAAMMALGRADLRLRIQVIHSAANIAGFLVAVRYGFVAVAAAYTVRAFVLMPLDLVINNRLGAFRARDLWNAVLPQAAATLIMAGAVYGLVGIAIQDQSDPAKLAAGCAVGVVSYASGMLVFGRGTLRIASEFVQVLVARRRTD